MFPDPAVYDLESLADVTGMPAHQIVQLWRSLGFPDPVGGERIFTETDAEMLGNVADADAGRPARTRPRRCR